MTRTKYALWVLSIVFRFLGLTLVFASALGIATASWMLYANNLQVFKSPAIYVTISAGALLLALGDVISVARMGPPVPLPKPEPPRPPAIDWGASSMDWGVEVGQTNWGKESEDD